MSRLDDGFLGRQRHVHSPNPDSGYDFIVAEERLTALETSYRRHAVVG